MPTVLKDMTLDEISLVDRPANPGARVVIFKRDTGTRNPAAPAEKPERSVFKRFVQLVKDMGMNGDGEGGGDDDPTTFGEELLARRLGRISCDLSDFLGALYQTITETLASGEPDKEGAIEQAAADFSTALMAAVPQWLQGAVGKIGRKISAARLKKLKDMHHMIGEVIREQEEGDESMAKIQLATLPEDLQGILKGFGILEPSAEQVEFGKATLAKAKKPPDEGDGAGDGDEEANKKAKKKMAKADLATLPETVKKVLGDLGIDEPTYGQAEQIQKLAGSEDIYKGLSPKAQELIRKSQQEAEEAKAIVKSLRDETHKRDCIAKASSLGLSGDEWTLIRDIEAKLPAETAKAVLTKFAAQHAQIEKGGLFTEYGRSGDAPAGGDAWQKIEALAAERISKGAKETKEQAIAKVLETPEGQTLYVQYQAESRERR